MLLIGYGFCVTSNALCWLIGTAACVMWKLRVKGRLFHSGLPHKGINSMELAMEAMAYVQKRFYEDFPAVRHMYYQGPGWPI